MNLLEESGSWTVCVALPRATHRVRVRGRDAIGHAALEEGVRSSHEKYVRDRGFHVGLAGAATAAIRGSDKLEDSSMVARTGGHEACPLCGALYFEAHGTPQTPSDLKAHNCVRFSLSGHADLWEFSKDGRTERIAIGGRYAVTSSLAVRDALRAGFGLSLMPQPYVDEDLREGRLVSALDDWGTVETTLYAVYPSRHHLAPKIRVFLDFLVKAFTSTGHLPA